MRNLCFIFLLLPVISFTQSVKGTFSPTEDFTYAFLYKATPEGADYIDRGKLDGSGSFEIKLDSSLKPGIYKIVYAVPPEENNFDFIYDGKETVAFNFSYENGVEFKASEENKLWNSYLKSMNMVNQTISNYYSKENTDKAGFNAIFKVAKDTQTAYEESADGKLVSEFIVANRPYIPTKFENLSTYSKNLKSNFFEQIDFGNPLLQSSTFLVDRVNTYVFDMVQNAKNSTYKQHIDDIANAIKDEDITIKISLLSIVWQRFVTMENHELANYIADNYLIDLAKTTENKVLEQTLTSHKNTAIGAKAPNFEISLEEKTTNLHQLKNAEHYLLIFWSSGCGHCLEELPKVKDLVASIPNLKVIAFGLEDDKKDWEKEIKNYPNFIHAIGLGKWDNQTVQTYGIAATPTYFILNENKVIAAKPYDYEELEVVLNRL